MKVKKYVASTMPEAMKRIRQELGNDAVILNSKETHKGGILGFFKKRSIEVVAAVDPLPMKPKPQKNPKENSPQLPKNDGNTPKADENVLKEIKQLRKILEIQAEKENSPFPPDYEIVYHHLIDQEVDKEIAGQIMQSVVSKHKEWTEKPELKRIFQDTEEEIRAMLEGIPFGGLTFTRKVIQFVGPTGVGKTTTLAKVAATCMLKHHKRVAFITTDTYRIAAIEQLKTYARILDVPIEVAYNLNDYKQALDKFSSYDLILVDTAGRNFRDARYVKELKNMLHFEQNMETYLVLSLTAKPNDISDIYAQFEHIPIKKLIFTKVDETKQYGSLLSTVLKQHIGIAYLTNGQDVPDDLVTASKEKISKLIAGEYRDA